MALSRASKNPIGWQSGVRGLGPNGIEGGVPGVCSWEVLSQALADMSNNGMEPNMALLRGIIRKTKQHLRPEAPREAGDQGGQLRDLA